MPRPRPAPAYHRVQSTCADAAGAIAANDNNTSNRSTKRIAYLPWRVRTSSALLHAIAAALLDERFALVRAHRALAAVAVLLAALRLAQVGVHVSVQLAIAVRRRPQYCPPPFALHGGACGCPCGARWRPGGGGLPGGGAGGGGGGEGGSAPPAVLPAPPPDAAPIGVDIGVEGVKVGAVTG